MSEDFQPDSNDSKESNLKSTFIQRDKTSGQNVHTHWRTFTKADQDQELKKSGADPLSSGHWRTFQSEERSMDDERSMTAPSWREMKATDQGQSSGDWRTAQISAEDMKTREDERRERMKIRSARRADKIEEAKKLWARPRSTDQRASRSSSVLISQKRSTRAKSTRGSRSSSINPNSSSSS